ncbi:hypothetical protein [Mycobacteroides abscessus]|uniref:hypothetical protein n=1 Tax=Mycobacteroides abscessus TaxID=36809 RepID=UPI0002F37549|nr:hypothetical protein [Mycobacteroides abscessus]RIS67706.1 hypothetical protein D2E70_17275 [Mycobacteroides abscessus]
MARPPRDRFPNACVGDLVETPTGWAVVAPLYCPNWHSIEEPGWKHSTDLCDCGTRHYTWTCHCGATTYAPKLGRNCQIRSGCEGVMPPDHSRT